MIIDFKKLDLTEYKPLYNSSPVVVKFITGDEIICTAYRHRENYGVMICNPLVLTFKAEESRDSGITQIKAKFSRWLLLTDDNAHFIESGMVITVALLSPLLVSEYLTWSVNLYDNEKLYQNVTKELSNNAVIANTTEPTNELFEEILRTYTPKGRPN